MSGMGPDYPGMGQDAPPGFIAQQQQANDQQLVSQRPGSPSEFMGSQGKLFRKKYIYFKIYPLSVRLKDYCLD